MSDQSYQSMNLSEEAISDLLGSIILSDELSSSKVMTLTPSIHDKVNDSNENIHRVDRGDTHQCSNSVSDNQPI
jgi:hypothetical protein